MNKLTNVSVWSPGGTKNVATISRCWISRLLQAMWAWSTIVHRGGSCLVLGHVNWITEKNGVKKRGVRSDSNLVLKFALRGYVRCSSSGHFWQFLYLRLGWSSRTPRNSHLMQVQHGLRLSDLNKETTYLLTYLTLSILLIVGPKCYPSPGQSWWVYRQVRQTDGRRTPDRYILRFPL